METRPTAKMRGRFAPTPSGLLHLGNAGTALLAWLQVRAAGGTIVMRLEDLDKPRCKPEWSARLLADMRWLGLDWDEGPDVGGRYGPYTQSERTALYEDAFAKLQKDGYVYPCYCSRADLLSAASAPHGLAAEGPSYTGTCRSLTEAEKAELGATKTPSWRFRLPEGEPTFFVDGALGAASFEPGAGGDFVVRRADDYSGYQLAVVVDDAAMGITHVLRGEDLFDSTPRQLRLYEALGLSAPQFAHVPLLLGPDGSRLSKRHGSVAIAERRERGTAPETIIGYLAWLYGLLDRPEPATPASLVSLFSLDKLTRGPIMVGGAGVEKV